MQKASEDDLCSSTLFPEGSYIFVFPINAGFTPNSPESHTTWTLFFLWGSTPPDPHSKDVYLLGSIIPSFFPPLLVKGVAAESN